jgi:hypothetical protein
MARGTEQYVTVLCGCSSFSYVLLQQAGGWLRRRAGGGRAGGTRPPGPARRGRPFSVVPRRRGRPDVAGAGVGGVRICSCCSSPVLVLAGTCDVRTTAPAVPRESSRGFRGARLSGKAQPRGRGGKPAGPRAPRLRRLRSRAAARARRLRRRLGATRARPGAAPRRAQDCARGQPARPRLRIRAGSPAN